MNRQTSTSRWLVGFGLGLFLGPVAVVGPFLLLLYLFTKIVEGSSFVVQVALLPGLAAILILALWLISTKNRRVILFDRLQRAGRFAPFIYSFNVLVYAIIFFASLTFVLVIQGWIEVSDPVGDFRIADRFGLYAELSHFYVWHFLDAIPLLKVNQTLQWTVPLSYEGPGFGALLLLFKLTVIFPVIAAFVGYWKHEANPIPWEDLLLRRVRDDATGLRVTFLGVSTLLFDDGETAFLIDGFFTRPGKFRTLFRKIEPDQKLITRYLERLNIKKLAAVIVVHSHHDHALDAPVVAKLTAAQLIGSQSTAAIGRAFDLPESSIKVVNDGDTHTMGRFQVQFVTSRHSPITFLKRLNIDRILFAGAAKESFPRPARAIDYKEGGSYSLLIEHDGKRMLVQASAGYVSDALHGHRADVVFLGIGTLGKQTDKYREEYWREVVQAVSARRVIPIHWDDFSISLDQPLVSQSGLVDNVERSIRFLLQRGERTDVDVRIPEAWVKVDPFERLS